MKSTNKLAFGMVLGIAAFAAAPSAWADACHHLQDTGTFCGTFVYSSGGSNSYTVTFGSGGAFNLNGNSPGTYTCDGGGFVEADYAFGGSENQVWYGRAKNAGTTANGDGKSTTNGYLYTWKLSPGACPSNATGKPGHSQAEGK